MKPFQKVGMPCHQNEQTFGKDTLSVYFGASRWQHFLSLKRRDI